MRNLTLGNTKTERKMFGVEASSVWQTNSGSPVMVMVMDRGHISRGQSSISALPQVGARGGVGKHGAGWRRCGNQAPGHQLLQSVTHWTIVTEHGTNARCHGPGWPPSHKTCSEEQEPLGLVNSDPHSVHRCIAYSRILDMKCRNCVFA